MDPTADLPVIFPITPTPTYSVERTFEACEATGAVRPCLIAPTALSASDESAGAGL